MNDLIPGQTPTTTAMPPEIPAVSGSNIDPRLAPFLMFGLGRAQELFFGPNQPSFFPGQTYVSPSEQTLAALQQQEQLATQPNPFLAGGGQAYLSSLGGIGRTAAGEFLGGSPERTAAIEAATRPIMQQFTESTLPALQSAFSRAGRYGSGAQTRAIGQAQEAAARAIGDVGTNIAYQDYARERGLQQAAQMGLGALGQAAPSFFQASFLPSQALATVGASREAIAAQPLQEQMQRFQFGQQLPYQQLGGFLSSVYGTPMANYPITQPAQTNRVGQALGGAALGYSLGGPVGAGLGGLFGYFG